MTEHHLESREDNQPLQGSGWVTGNHTVRGQMPGTKGAIHSSRGEDDVFTVGCVELKVSEHASRDTYQGKAGGAMRAGRR